MAVTETINAQAPTLLGYPIQITLDVTGKADVDVTHALRAEGQHVTLDITAVLHAITNAYHDGMGEGPA